MKEETKKIIIRKLEEEIFTPSETFEFVGDELVIIKYDEDIRGDLYSAVQDYIANWASDICQENHIFLIGYLYGNLEGRGLIKNKEEIKTGLGRALQKTISVIGKKMHGDV